MKPVLAATLVSVLAIGADHSGTHDYQDENVRDRRQYRTSPRPMVVTMR